MKKNDGLHPASRSQKNPPASKTIPLPGFMTPQNPVRRFFLMLGLLVLGFHLIQTHTTVNLCLVGILLWGIALYQSLAWFAPVPGVNAFSGTVLRNLGGTEEWGALKLTLAGLLILGLVGACVHFILWWHWFALLISLLAIGALFAVLEKHSVAFWTRGSETPSLNHSFPWAPLLIVLVGSFFLFYDWDAFPIGRDNNALYNMEIANSYLFPNGRTSPYVDGWTWGNPSFPFFLIGLFFKVVGSSQSRGTLFIAVMNLAGYLAFYGFLRFYLSKSSALAATLLLSACHWSFYFARETSAGGLLVPFECFTFYYFARAMEKGKRGDFALLGTLLACLWMVAVQGRVMAVLLTFTFFALWFFRQGEMAPQKKSWLLAGGTALLWYLPMFLYYLHSTHPLGLGAEEVGREAAWGNGKFFIPWVNIQQGMQMFHFRSVDSMTGNLPRVSPWEGLLLLAGFGWCLRRAFNPVFALLLLGFFGGMAASVLSNNATNVPRALAVVPFVYSLVGIGLDRLGRLAAAPLGSQGRFMRFLFVGAFCLFSIGWQYDVFFHQLPRVRTSYSVDGSDQGGQRYLIGKLLVHYIHGWASVVDSPWCQEDYPEGSLFYDLSDIDATASLRSVFWPAQSSLPLKNLPPSPKGAVLILGDVSGKAFEDWIHFYYPNAQSRVLLNPFGDVTVRLWEISSDEIQAALKRSAEPPPGGLRLEWYDVKNRRLGEWLIPTLSSSLVYNDYFRDAPGAPGFPWDKVAYFTVQGSLKSGEQRPLAILTNGKVEGTFGGKPVHWEAASQESRFDMPATGKGWVPFKLRYTMPSQANYFFGISRRTPTGWDVIPSSDWKP